MMRSLWLKELRAVRPFLILVLFLIVAGTILELLMAAPDLTDMSDHLSIGAPQDALLGSFFIFLIAFTMASGLLVREHDEGTQEFLDSLPLSRSRSFWVKVCTALTILALLPLDSVIEQFILFRVTATSLDPGHTMQLVLIMAVLQMAQIYVFVAVGLLLSFFRRFAWVMLPLLFFAYSWLHPVFPQVQYLNPFSLMDAVVSSTSLVFPVKHVSIQLLLGTLCLLLAWAVYLQTADALHRLQTRLARGAAGRIVLGFTVLLIAGLWTSVVVVGFYRDGGTAAGSQPWSEWESGQIQTQDFTLTYRGYQARQARELATVADSLNHQVRSFLGAGPSQTNVTVDLTSHIPHLAGLAHWQKINMDLSSCVDAHDRAAVLGHEMVHVCISELADSYLSEHFSSTQFFHEGLASYLEYRLFRRPKERADFRSVAAAAYQRCKISMEELTNSPQLRSRLDEKLIYNLGEVFVQALVNTYGDEAPGQVLRAFGRESAPDDLAGEALWRDGFQAAGYSFDVVVAGFFSELEALVAANDSLLSDLPRLHATTSVDSEGKFVVDLVDRPSHGSWLAVCRFRQTARDNERTSVRLSPGFARINASFFPGSLAWYQLGWLDAENPRRGIFEEWQSVPIR